MSIPLFDAHCDSITREPVLLNGLRKNTETHVDLERSLAYAPYGQFFAIFDSPHFRGCGGPELYEKHLATFCREMAANRDIIRHCRSAAEIRLAAAAGLSAAILSVEGAELLDCSIERLREAYIDGVRAVNLTWNFENELSGSNAEGADKGLTEKGKAFVCEMQSLGMMVDVSHLSVPGFWDVVDTAKKPIIASHSNSIALAPHKRNLTDEQFSAIVKLRGFVGINLARDFVGEGERVDMGSVVGHIERFLALGGEKTVGLGCDLDGIQTMPEGFSGLESMEKLYNALLQRNYSEKLVCDIFYNNLVEVIERVCDM